MLEFGDRTTTNVHLQPTTLLSLTVLPQIQPSSSLLPHLNIFFLIKTFSSAQNINFPPFRQAPQSLIHGGTFLIAARQLLQHIDLVYSPVNFNACINRLTLYISRENSLPETTHDEKYIMRIYFRIPQTHSDSIFLRRKYQFKNSTEIIFRMGIRSTPFPTLPKNP